MANGKVLEIWHEAAGCGFPSEVTSSDQIDAQRG